MNLIVYAEFTASKVGKAGLTDVTVDVKSINRSSGAVATVATAAATTELMHGVYFYRLTAADLQTFDYVCTFITADSTVDAKNVSSLWTRFSEAVTVDSAGAVTLPAAYDAAKTAAQATALATVAADVTAIKSGESGFDILATVGAGSTASSLILTPVTGTLSTITGAYVGKLVVVKSTTNANLLTCNGTISAWNGGTSTATLSPALPAAPAVGDTVAII